ncbi:MAG: DUF3347 domain-containing protein [Bacteroidetes Order II. Incertae sedis bacterium]|nr:DUF3347 domain-containing protein [Bacteroidetes Order II. bacterium]
MKFFFFFLLLSLPFTYTQSHKMGETCEHCKENCACTGETCVRCKKGDGHKAGEACEHCKKGDGHKAGEACEHCKKGDGHKTSSEEPKESATAAPQNVLEAGLRSELRSVLTAYFSVKDALVKDNPNDAITQAKALRLTLGKVTRDKFQANQRTAYISLAAKIDESAASISSANAIKDQRMAFIRLSEATIAFVKTFNVLDMPAYLQFCPMANQGKGADWLSMEKVIKNPYYGKSMLTCGNVKATIN